MANPHTILLNGRRYDALTGRLLKDPDSTPKDDKPKKTPNHHPKISQGGTIDGFVTSTSKQLKNKVNSSAKKAKHHIAPHAQRVTEHSKTLMRTAVKKPDISKPKGHHQAQHPQRKRVNYSIANRVAMVAPAKEALVNHAQAVKKSDFVKKFNELTTPANPVAPDPTKIQTTANSEVHLKNLEKLAAADANPNDDSIFTEAALKLADSHQPIKRNQIRFYERIADKFKISVKALFLITMGLILIVSVLVIGVIFKNNVLIYVADTRTGIHGILPTSVPSGFSTSSITYSKTGSNGTVVINYKSNSDSRNFTVSEQNSTMDSATLASSVVQPEVGASYQTYQVGGRTVYVFNHSAAWVDGGIYYLLTNDANLSSDQIVQIAGTT